VLSLAPYRSEGPARAHRRRKRRVRCFLRFPGQYFDAETGLHSNLHRYYDPGIGRYVSADPIGQFGMLARDGLSPSGVGANVFEYGLNNPLNLADPLGLSYVFINVNRQSIGPQSTIGTLSINGNPAGNTLEPPWRNNTPYQSSIPPGIYFASPYKSPTFGPTIILRGVTGRSYILFHPGNTPSNTQGCILPGTSAGSNRVNNSTAAFNNLMNTVNTTLAVDAFFDDTTNIIVNIQ